MNVARNHIAPQTGDAPGRAGDGLSYDGMPGLPPFADPQAVDPPVIDWHALRSRLFATHDRLGVLGEDAAASRLRLRGSFDGCAASALHAYEESSRPINLDASSNGKPVQGKDNPVADVNGSGERG